ncbi:MAG: hypothetical protein H6Q36_1365 [Chloroflexi bacterium]|nr:hypothetical protein [Chloroflexota bacterium]
MNVPLNVIPFSLADRLNAGEGHSVYIQAVVAGAGLPAAA